MDIDLWQIFFLAVVIVTFVPAVSPVSPYTSFIPLAFIIAVSALREAYEDVVSTYVHRIVATGNSISHRLSESIQSRPQGQL